LTLSINTIIKRYKSNTIISTPISAVTRNNIIVTRRALAASDTDIKESTGESEDEGESKSGDPRDNKNL
jgi:hypothetical protein